MSAQRSDPPGRTPDADPLAEQTLESKLVYQGAFLRIFADRVRAADGHVAAREYLRHPGAVMIVPLLDDDTVVVERQYRYPLRRSFIEFPAGKLDPGEDILVCAKRELREETGYAAAQWIHLGGFHNAIGYSDEKIDVFIARGLTRSAGQTDLGEVIEVSSAPWRTLLRQVRTGEVTDVKTIVGVHWLETYLAGDWPL